MKKTGALTLTNLEPEHCLAIMEHMHTKKFLGRKVFVTSVVNSSPTKPLPNVNGGAVSTDQESLPGNQVTTQSNASESVPLLASPVLDPRAGSKNPNIQSLGSKNIDDFEFDSPLKAFSKTKKDNNFANMVELPNKRKALKSPELTDVSRKDKKAAKKDQKSKAKSEMRAKLQLEISPHN